MQPQDDKPAAEPVFHVEGGFLVGVGRTQKGTELRMTQDLGHMARDAAEALMRFQVEHSPL